MPGSVHGLYLAAAAGQPMEACDHVDLVAGRGITGDRYAEGTGHWSDPRWPDQELTLIEVETAARLGIDPGALRRNVVTLGVRLDDLVGRSFHLGGVEVRGVRPCDPCAYIERLLGRPGLRAALEGCGGLRAAVVTTGRIGVGDPVLT